MLSRLSDVSGADLQGERMCVSVLSVAERACAAQPLHAASGGTESTRRAGCW